MIKTHQARAISVVVALVGVLTAAVLTGVKAVTILILAFAGLLYALIWEGGVRASDAIQKWLRRRQNRDGPRG